MTHDIKPNKTKVYRKGIPFGAIDVIFFIIILIVLGLVVAHEL